MTTGEVALVLGVSPASVRNWATQGVIPCSVTAGGHRRFDLAAVRAALDTVSEPRDSLTSEHIVELNIGRVPARLLAGLPSIPNVRVSDADPPMVRRGARARPLSRVAPPEGDNVDVWFELLEAARARSEDSPLPVVMATWLDAHLRRRLADAGISYLDGQGHVYLDAGWVLVATPERRHRPDERRSVSLRDAGVRVVQALLGTPARVWTVRAAADAAGASVGTVSATFRQLVDAGLAAREPAPRGGLSLLDSAAVLDWLAEVPAARQPRRERLLGYRYGRSTTGLVRELARTLDAIGERHAFTGAAAAHLAEAGPTTVTRVATWVDPHRPLAEVAQRLDLDATAGTDANVELLADLSGCGLLGATGDPATASPTRVYLDLLETRRGRDIAEHYRALTIGTAT